MTTETKATTSHTDNRPAELIDVIRDRWSPRAFDVKPVEAWKQRVLFAAAQWAPSCFNEQPWRFMVGDKEKSPESHAAILDILVPQNQVWAKNAPLLMLGVIKLNFTHNNKPNRHAQHDLGLAVENMVLQAMALDLHCHQMAGIDPEKAMDVFGIPRGEYEVMTGIAFGYLGSADTLPDELKKRELEAATRKPLSEMFFSSYWQGPNPL